MTWADILIAAMKQLCILTFSYYYMKEVQHLWD